MTDIIQLFNADNWVYMFVEIYLKEKYSLPNDWQNPIDNRNFAVRIPSRLDKAGAKLANNAAASQTSSTTEAWQFDITNTLDHEVMVTDLPTDDALVDTPKYEPGCPVCQPQASIGAIKSVA